MNQALDITAAAADRAELLERAAYAADLDGRYEAAERSGFDAIAAFEAAGDRTGVARTSALIGSILADASKLTETVELLEQAIAKVNTRVHSASSTPPSPRSTSPGPCSRSRWRSSTR